MLSTFCTLIFCQYLGLPCPRSPLCAHSFVTLRINTQSRQILILLRVCLRGVVGHNDGRKLGSLLSAAPSTVARIWSGHESSHAQDQATSLTNFSLFLAPSRKISENVNAQLLTRWKYTRQMQNSKVASAYARGSQALQPTRQVLVGHSPKS